MAAMVLVTVAVSVGRLIALTIDLMIMPTSGEATKHMAFTFFADLETYVGGVVSCFPGTRA